MDEGNAWKRRCPSNDFFDRQTIEVLDTNVGNIEGKQRLANWRRSGDVPLLLRGSVENTPSAKWMRCLVEGGSSENGGHWKKFKVSTRELVRRRKRVARLLSFAFVLPTNRGRRRRKTREFVGNHWLNLSGTSSSDKGHKTRNTNRWPAATINATYTGDGKVSRYLPASRCDVFLPSARMRRWTCIWT